MRRTILRLGAGVVVALALATTATAGPPAPAPRLGVVSFNILAPIWASPTWYPDGLDTSLLDTAARRAHIVEVLWSQTTADVICLQEVQDSELAAIRVALGPGWDGWMSVNDRHWWSDWLVELPWAPNGTAVLVRRSALRTTSATDVALSDDGNHALVWRGVQRASGIALRVASIHLDSDSGANRVREARSLVEQLPAQRGVVDVVCGDVNEDTVKGSVGGVLGRASFVDVLASLGNREPTHPWDSQYNGADKWAIIDHVLLRGGRPLAGDVLDFGVWGLEDELARIEANLVNTGSDHFPVRADVSLGP